MWESGARASRASGRMPEIRKIAEQLKLPADEAAAMEGMWFAAGSVTATAPRTRWSHNFPDPPGPAWAWLRPAAVGDDGTTALEASGWWTEALQAGTTVSCGWSGLLAQFPTTIPNPPLEVKFRVPCWADFGRGRIPQAVADGLAAILVDAREIVRLSPALDPPLSAEVERATKNALDDMRRAAEHLKLAWRIFAPHTGMIKPPEITYSLDGSDLEPTTWPGPAVIGSDGAVQRQALMSATQLRMARDGRGLSRQQVAEQVSALNPRNPVTARAIEIMEATGRFPDVAGVVAALDHCYQCDGRLGVDQVFDSLAQPIGRDGRHVLRFPHYYIGPIWIHAFGRNTGEVGTVDLVWGPWRRQQRIRSGMLLTTRKAANASQPLQVAIPRGWRLVAGVGAAPTAADINHGWYPRSVLAGITLIRDTITTLHTSQGIPAAARPDRP
jgi:hypothetical protein